MRILHLIYSFNTGGAERMVIALANSQITHHQVGLCTTMEREGISFATGHI